MKTSLAVAIAATLFLAAPSAHAEVRLSGFGQIVAGATLDNDDVFPGRSYDSSVDFQNESLFGLQVDADLNERVSVTGQILAKGSEDFEAELAWAYANFKLTDSVSAKVGRQRIPLYRFSDFLDVGYAYPWIAPPRAMYNQPWSNADGASLSHAASFGPFWSQAQVFYGNFEGDVELFGTPVHATLDKIAGASWDVEYDEWLSVRAAYFQGDITIAGTSLDALTPTLRALGMGDLADRMDFVEDKGTFKSLGFKAEKFNVIAIGEYAEIDIEDSALENTDRTDWYATLGYKLGAFTPHMSYGRSRGGSNDALLAGVPTASPLYGPVFLAANSQRRDDEFRSVGVRWDFAANTALKLDYSRYVSNLDETTAGEVVSAAVAFTF